jgi:hypothetical protein
MEVTSKVGTLPRCSKKNHKEQEIARNNPKVEVLLEA